MLKRTRIQFLESIGCLLMVVCLLLAANGQENIQFSQGKTDEGLGNTLSVQLMNYKGRGIDLPVTLNYSSNVWRIDNLKTIDIGVFQTITQVIYSEHSTAGWKTSLDLPEIEWPKEDDIYNAAGRSCGPPVCYSGPLRIRRVMIHMPDGSVHELREDDSAYPGSSTIDQTGTFYAVDGSRLRYDSIDADTGTLFLPSGTRYVLDAGSGQVIDRNGNALTFNAASGQWSDTLNRTVGMPFPASFRANPQPTAYAYSLPGLAGVNGGNQTYTFIWKHLSDTGVLTPGSGSLRVMGSHYLPFPDSPPTAPSGNNYPQQHGNMPTQTTFPHDSLFYSDADDGAMTLVVGKGQNLNQVFDPVVLSEIILPDTRSYKFTYNIYGEITKIVYPTAAYEQYQIGALGGSYTLNPPYDQAERGISSRKLSEKGDGSDLLEWTYSRTQVSAGSWGPQNAYRYRIVAPDTTCSETYKVKLNANAHGGMNNQVFWDWDFVDPINGAAVESRAYGKSATACGGSLLRRELTAYERTANPLGTPYPNGLQVYAYRNIRPVKKTTVLFEDGSAFALAQTSTLTYDTTYQYSTGVDQTAAAVCDYVSLASTTAQTATIDSISYGTFLKSTITTYTSDATYPTFRGANILGLPTSVSIYKGGTTTPVSRSEMIYDECPTYCTSAGHALPTSSRVWDSTKGAFDNSSAYLATHATFDLFGNRTTVTDAKGYKTTTAYDSTYYTYPISVTSEVPDPTPNGSPHGSSTAFTTSTNYNAVTGLLLSTTDINGQTTYLEYNDALLRPTKVTAPNGQQTITIYGTGTSSATRKVTVQTQINTYEWTEVTSYYDALGRTYLIDKKDASDLEGDSYTFTCYDTMGRVSKSSSPFRGYSSQDYCNSSNTLQWTVPEYDDLSRTKKITLPVPSPSGTPGNVIVTYGISTTTGSVGTTKTITDEAGKQRKGITDALGNMVRVTEDPSGQNLTTDYTFDTLGNLRMTVQGDQIRYFNYDSLGRVLRAKQVEQDVNTSLALPVADSVTGNNSWTVKYTYDDNSNIATLTDARNTTTSAIYDRLNRLVTRTYNDGTTPNVDFYYDGKGLASPSALPNGKTTKVSNSVSETKYTKFDEMGRVETSQQVTDGQTYNFAYKYNLAGALIEETYPSGRVVKNTINMDGELAQVQSKKNSSAGYFTYADAFRYNAAGAIMKMQLGNGYWENAVYNERQQVTQIGLGTLDNQQNVLKLDFAYEGANPATIQADRNNGSMRKQTITVPAVGATPGFIAVQEYEYDGLNRLTSAAEHPQESSTTTWKQEFSYDRYGNKNFVTGTGHTTTLGSCAAAVCNPAFPTNNTNRNRFSDGQNYTYDTNGSILHNALGQNFGYDAENRQTTFFANGQTGTPSMIYSYDGEGKRIKKVVPGLVGSSAVTFVYDAAGKLVAEYPEGGQEEIPEGYVPSVSYMTVDHLGSPRVVTDANGAVLSRKDFAAFGDETISPQRTASLGYVAPDIRQDYTGYQKDDESGLEYAQARYYNTQNGRFTSVDPLTASGAIRNPQTFNRYSYVTNSPYKFVDPLGLRKSDIGVLETDDEFEARQAEHQSDRDLQESVNDDYKRRHKAPEPATTPAPPPPPATQPQESSANKGPVDTSNESAPTNTPTPSSTPQATPAPPAYPVNFRQTVSRDPGQGNLYFEYRWDSSTGRLADLTNCTVGEYVSYPATPFPAPFPVLSPPNPTIRNHPATLGAISDTHSTPRTFRTPYFATTFTAVQTYRYICSNVNGGQPVTLMGPLNIVRSVIPDGNRFKFRIEKSGNSSSRRLP